MAVHPSDNSKAGGDQQGGGHTNLWARIGGPASPEKPRKHDSGAADLERVTDYAEEKEIQSSNLETVRLAGQRVWAG